MKKSLANLVVGVMFSVASVAQAAPTLCSAGNFQPDGLSLADVTFNNLAATDCYGVVTGAATADNIGFTGFTGVATTPAGQSSTGTFGGADFTLAAAVSDISGSWSLGWSGVTGPFTVDLVAVVQTANAFASYFFDNLTLAVSPGSGQGQWIINFVVNESTEPLKSLSIFMASTTAPGGGGTTEPPPPPSNGTAPEPGTMALMTLALLAIGLTRRQAAARRR